MKERKRKLKEKKEKMKKERQENKRKIKRKEEINRPLSPPNLVVLFNTRPLDDVTHLKNRERKYE